MCVHDRVQEVAVVRDDDQRPVVADQELAQPVDRVEVEVVGRLVEEQRVRAAEQRLRQQDAHLLAALQLGHRPLVQRVGDVEAGEQDGGVALGRVPVVLADDAFELAEAHAVLVGQRRLGVEPIALLERRPQHGVAHDHRVDDAVRVEGELILAQDAEPRRPADAALLRLQVARQQLHEGRLAGAVRPGQAVAATRPRTSSTPRRRAPSTRTAWTRPRPLSSCQSSLRAPRSGPNLPSYRAAFPTTPGRRSGGLRFLPARSRPFRTAPATCRRPPSSYGVAIGYRMAWP